MNQKIKRSIKEIDIKSKIYYIGVILLALAAVIAGIVTKGETVKNVLFNHDDVFMDFFNSVNNCGFAYDAYDEFGVIYPPLVVLFYKATSLLFPAKLAAQEIKASSLGMIIFTIYTVACVMLLIKCIKKYKIGNGLDKFLFAVSMFLSVPMIFLLERGNILILVISLLFVYLYGYDSEKASTRHLAYICLAIAVSIKLYPVVFGLLLLRKKKNFKNIAWCVFYGIIFFFVPFIFIGGFSQLFVLIKNILYTSSMFGNKGYGFKVNITNTFAMFGDLLHHSYIFESIGNAVMISAVIIGVLLILFGKFNSNWKLYAIISLFLVMVPGFSYVYSIAYMLIPLVAFLNEKKTRKSDYIYLLLFILQFGLFIAKKDELFSQFEGSELALNITTLIESVVLLLMMAMLYLDGIITTFKSYKGKKILHIPTKAVASVAMAGIVLVCCVFSVYYTPTKSGFSITSVDCFQIDEDNQKDQKTLEDFYEFAKKNFNNQKVLAFPKIDLTTKLSDIASNVSYYDISYYDNSVKTQKGIEKCKAEYIVIYNAMKADINNTDKQLSKNEKNQYLQMYRDISKYCWSKGYNELKTFTVNDDIDITVWQRGNGKNKKEWTNGGKGTRDNPYLISTAVQLNNFSKFVNAGARFKNKYIMLTNDIDMKDIKDFKPIGYERNNNYFKGIFDGNGYSIKNLNIVVENYKDVFDDDIKNDVALFGKLCGKIVNLTVENSTFKGFCAAVFARSCSNSNNAIINCISKNNTIIGTRCGEIVDDYCGSIRSVLAINNKCTSKGYKNVVAYTDTNNNIESCYTDTLYKKDNYRYLPYDVMTNQAFVDSLNDSANHYNDQIHLEYTSLIHKIYYNKGKTSKDIDEMKYPDPSVKLSQWVLNGGQLALTHNK